MKRRLEMSFEDQTALEREHDRELSKGRAFLGGVTGLEIFATCELVLAHPQGGEPLRIGVTVMTPLADQERLGGVGLQLDEEAGPALAQFVSRAPPASPDSGGAPTMLERLRNLSLAQQVKLARTSSLLQERTTLERMLGKHVWEPLLRNGRITLPEVARMARKGTVPRPLIEQIAEKAIWARAPAVRRALLSNPKLPKDSLLKVLRMTPKHELKLMEKQTAYSRAVREAARRLLGRN